MQDEAVLAERYLDGTIDALDLLLCASACTAVTPERAQREESGSSTKDASEASTSPSSATPRVALSAAPDQDAPSDDSCHCSVPASMARHHAGQLTYDEFVLRYMAPNLPVMIQVCSESGMCRFCPASCSSLLYSLTMTQISFIIINICTTAAREHCRHMQGMTEGWAASKDWVDQGGGINLSFLAERFGTAQIWATECTRYRSVMLRLV